MDGPVWQNKGLSCVENYILHALQECDVCPDPLYYQSGLSFADIAICLVTEKTYATFNGVDRLQHIAAEIGLIDYQYRASVSLPNGFSFPQGSYAMVCVTPSYIRDKYQEKLWRDDHYILLTGKTSDTTYSYINDHPLDCGELPIEELKHNYNGSVIYVQIKHDMDSSWKRDCLHNYLAFSKGLRETAVAISSTFDDVDKIRDLLLVWKTLRYRLKAFTQSYLQTDSDTGCLQDLDILLKDIEQQLFLLEYRKAKKRPLTQEWYDKTADMQMRDQLVLNNIRKQLLELWERTYGCCN